MASIILDNTFTVGTELQSVTILINGIQSLPAVNIGHLKHFSAKQEQTPLTIIPITGGGLPIHRNLYHGWSGRLQFARFNGAITAMALGMMQNFIYRGIESYITLGLQVNNANNGTVDNYTVNNAVFSDITFGDFDSTKEVDEEINWRSQSITYIGSTSGLQATTATLPPVIINFSPSG